MKVLIVPEDPTYDQYILKPIVERIFSDLERPARIEMLQNPRLTSVVQALDPAVLAAVVVKYPMVDSTELYELHPRRVRWSRSRRVGTSSVIRMTAPTSLFLATAAHRFPSARGTPEHGLS